GIQVPLSEVGDDQAEGLSSDLRQRFGARDARLSPDSGSHADGELRRDAWVTTDDEQSSFDSWPAHRSCVWGRSQAHGGPPTLLGRARQVDQPDGRGQCPALPKEMYGSAPADAADSAAPPPDSRVLPNR